ncbi:MAG: adenylate/guanylate cyclase domain-containing protein [Candidatus Rifleibacteriota bacterium]
MIVVVPLLVGKFLITGYIDYLLEEHKTATRSQLREDLNDFEKDIEIEKFLTTRLESIQTDFSSFCAAKDRNSLKLSEKADFLRARLNDEIGTDCLYIFLFNKDTGEIVKRVGHKFAKDIGYLGQAAVKIFFKGLIRQNEEKARKLQNKLFTQVFTTILGTKEALKFDVNKLNSYFSTKLGGRRLFSWLGNVGDYVTQQSEFYYFISFTEDSVSLKKHFSQARTKKNNSKIQRFYALLPADLNKFYFESDDGTLRSLKPLPVRLLRFASHANQSALDLNIDNNRLDTAPAKAFYIVSQTSIESYRKRLSRFKTFSSLGFLVIVFFSLYLLQMLCFEGRIPAKINTKLFLAVFASVVLPVAIFLVVSQRYFGFFQKLLYQNQRQSIEQELQLFELSIQNNQSMQHLKLRRFKDSLFDCLELSGLELKKIFNNELGITFDGYVFIRSDGLVLEELEKNINISSKNRERLDFLCQLFKGQACRIFSELRISSENFADEIKKNPHGRKILALGDLFSPLDLMNFCLQDGKMFGSESAQQGNFRLITFNLFSPKESGESAFIAFVLDAGKRSQKFLFQSADKENFFVKRENGVLYHKAVFQIADNDRAEKSEVVNSWPPQAEKDNDFRRIFQRMAAIDSKTSWLETAVDGSVNLFAGRKVAKLPLIVVSKAILDNNALKRSMLSVILLVFVLYAFLLIIFLADSLTSIFLNPVKALLKATSLVNRGYYPLIETGAVYEMGVLVEKFNIMTTGLQHRQRLERFVSEEATRNIEIESLDFQERSSKKIEAAVMFIHIREFAELCERLSADKIIELLNLYYSFIEPVIKENNGIIDKYVGDGVMVAFAGKSSGQKQSYSNSCKAALKLIKALTPLNKQLEKADLPRIKIGVGIACGKAIRGRIGAKKGRKDFTLIGNVVNLSARLEALTHKQKEASIMVSQKIEGFARDRFDFIDCGMISVKGKQNRQRVFLLKGLKL